MSFRTSSFEAKDACWSMFSHRRLGEIWEACPHPYRNRDDGLYFVDACTNQYTWSQRQQKIPNGRGRWRIDDRGRNDLKLRVIRHEVYIDHIPMIVHQGNVQYSLAVKLPDGPKVDISTQKGHPNRVDLCKFLQR
jgi:hypothetical protein